MMRRALVIDEKSFGKNHPKVAVGLNNLAALLLMTKRFDEAELLYKRAVEILENSLGPEHPDTIKVRRNLEILRSEI